MDCGQDATSIRCHSLRFIHLDVMVTRSASSAIRPLSHALPVYKFALSSFDFSTSHQPQTTSNFLIHYQQPSLYQPSLGLYYIHTHGL